MSEEKEAKPAGCLICGEESVTTSGPQLCFTGVALTVLCSMMLFFTLLSWWFGGDGFKDSILGDYVIPVLLLGVAVGVVASHVYSRRMPAESVRCTTET